MICRDVLVPDIYHLIKKWQWQQILLFLFVHFYLTDLNGVQVLLICYGMGSFRKASTYVRGNHICFAKYTLQTLESVWITARRIEAKQNALIFQYHWFVILSIDRLSISYTLLMLDQGLRPCGRFYVLFWSLEHYRKYRLSFFIFSVTAFFFSSWSDYG